MPEISMADSGTGYRFRAPAPFGRGIVRAGLAGLFTCILHAATSFGIDPDSLLRLSVGGESGYERLKSLHSYRLSGDLTLNGQVGTFSLSFKHPDHFHIMADLGAFSLTQAYDGKVAWQMDHNGKVSFLEGFERKDFLRSVYLQAYAYLFEERLPGSVSYDSVVSYEGKRYHSIRLYPFNNDTVIVYLDSTTGLQELSFSHTDNLETVTRSGDYRNVEGILIPYQARSLTRPVAASSEFHVGRVVLDAEFDSTFFSPPERRLVDYHFLNQADSVTLPFILKRGLIQLSATVNSRKKVRFILDSGASGNVLDSSLAHRLDLDSIGSMPVIGLAGTGKIKLVSVSSIDFGELSLQNQVTGSMDLRGTLDIRDDSLEFGGLLGYDFLSRFPLLINYADSSITVYNPDGFRPPDSGSVVDFYFTRQVPTVEATVDGVRGDYIVDIGNAFGVVIHEDFTKKNKLRSGFRDIQEVRRPMSGIGGSILGYSAVVRKFGIGDVTLSPLRVLLADSGSGLTGSTELAGNIGNHFLRRFTVLLDYPGKRILLYEKEQTP